MYKPFNMRDPATVNCRIYIGNLDESVTKDKLEEQFKQHGKIRGVNVQRGFGFVQFEEPAGALASIQKEHGVMFHGRKLNVKQAMDKNNKNANQNQNQQQHQNKAPMAQQQQQQNQNKSSMLPPQNQNLQQTQPQNQQKMQIEENPALMLNKMNMIDNKSSNMNKMNMMDNKSINLNMMDNKSNNMNKMNMMDNMNMNGPSPRKVRRGRGGGRGNILERDNISPGGEDYSYSREVPPFYGRDDNNFQNKPNIVPPPVIIPQGNRNTAPAEQNDCEIIVVSRALTEYAEYIEHRFKSIGLTVDLLYPNEDVPIGRVLAKISSRKSLYAVLVMPPNEEHRSLTLNILHGIPQEHRNMPVDDAVALAARNFDAYKRGDQSIQSKIPLGSAAMAAERHPEAIQILLNLLTDNRQLTTLQYDRIIKYLQEKRELQYKQEIGDSAELDKDFTKEAELQNRIMSILNNPNAPAATDVPKREAPAATTNSAPILNDPSVQKALDSLLQGDILKNITGSGRY